MTACMIKIISYHIISYRRQYDRYDKCANEVTPDYMYCTQIAYVRVLYEAQVCSAPLHSNLFSAVWSQVSLHRLNCVSSDCKPLIPAGQWNRHSGRIRFECVSRTENQCLCTEGEEKNRSICESAILHTNSSSDKRGTRDKEQALNGLTPWSMAFIKYSYDDNSNTCMFLLNGQRVLW